MNLYAITIEIETVIAAESADEAEDIALSQYREIVLDPLPEVGTAAQIFNEEHLPNGWDRECYAYHGGSGDVKVGDLLPKN